MVQAQGLLVDHESRCVHYHSDKDIVALQCYECKKYYACYQCHNEHEAHPIQRWSVDEFDQRVVMCGVCKHQMSINEYMMVESCPRCQSHFNHRCKFHYHLYFEI